MYYEINVSLKGRHFFATAKRSITDSHHLITVLQAFIKRFPISEGWKLGVNYYPECSTGVDVELNDTAEGVVIALLDAAYLNEKKKDEIFVPTPERLCTFLLDWGYSQVELNVLEKLDMVGDLAKKIEMASNLGYVWLPKYKRYIPKNSTHYTPEEELIRDYLFANK